MASLATNRDRGEGGDVHIKLTSMLRCASQLECTNAVTCSDAAVALLQNILRRDRVD